MPHRSIAAMAAAATWMLCTGPASAADLGTLEGKYTFDWHTEPASTTCVQIGGKLLAKLASAAFSCDLAPKTNSASGHPVQTCTKKGGTGEYLIFDTRAFCEEERETQASAE